MLRPRLRAVLILWFAIFSFFEVYAQNVIHDFNFDHLNYNGVASIYKPGKGTSSSTVHIFLDTKKYADYFLALSGEGSGSVLINSQVVFQSDGILIEQIWSIDSLAKKYRTDSVLVSLNGLSNIAAQVVQKRALKPNSKVETELLHLREAANRGEKNLWVILLLLLGLILGIYRMKYPKSFASLFDLSDIFRSRPRESFFYELRLMQAPSLIHYFSLAILVTLYTSKNWNSFGLEGALAINNLTALLAIFILSLVYPFSKFLVVSFFSGVFGLNTFTKFHHMESVRLTIVILSLAVLLSFIPVDEVKLLEPNTLLVSLFLLSVGLIFMKLLNKTLDKKLYLFSYICTTEIIPLLFIIKVFK